MLQRGMVRALTALLLATLAAGAASEGDSATWELTRGYDLCGSATLPPTLEAGLNRARDAAFDPRGSGTLWLASSAAASLRAVTLGGAPLREIPYDALVEGASRVSSFFLSPGTCHISRKLAPRRQVYQWEARAGFWLPHQEPNNTSTCSM